jgi:hypothetical protein
MEFGGEEEGGAAAEGATARTPIGQHLQNMAEQGQGGQQQQQAKPDPLESAVGAARSAQAPETPTVGSNSPL